MTPGELKAHDANITTAENVLLDLLPIVLKFAAGFDPPLAMALPFVQPVIASVIRHWFASLRSGLVTGEILPDGQGGFVSKAWADDPRHQLNPDGTFKF